MHTWDRVLSHDSATRGAGSVLCSMQPGLRDVLETAGRPQKAATRGHNEEPVRSWDPGSLVDKDKVKRMSELDQFILTDLFVALLGVLMFLVLMFLVYVVNILPRSINTV